jgi:ankyrin repeat protein
MFPSLATSGKLRKAIASSLPSFDPLNPPPSFSHQLARSTIKALIQATASNNLTALQHILFQPSHSVITAPSTSTSSHPPLSSPTPPPLVNLPDENGWSPIHHCVAVTAPSAAVLDALYMAGADVSLYTTDDQQYTPLHILALCASSASSSSNTRESAHALYLFAMHLVQDLNAPLAARDVHDNTCIHLAARRGKTVDVLIALLDCDTTGYARSLRNSDG